MSMKITGYASLFGIADLAGDEIAPGAFAGTLAARAQNIPILYQHDATRPIGQWHILKETRRGLWVEGALAAGVQLADEVAALIDQRVLRGLSIGFRPRRVTRGQGRVRRVLHEIELVEISIVTFPMQPLAAVQGPPKEEPDTTAKSLSAAANRLRQMTLS